MSKETFHSRYQDEKQRISKMLQDHATSISTLGESVHEAVQGDISTKDYCKN